MTLILHTGANPVTYDELRVVATPEPTTSHVPIPHHEIVELMRYTLGFYGHEVIEEHHGVTPDGNRYFGVLTLRSQYGEYSDMLGLRNSHDRSLPIGIAFGARVMVCDNLSMLADHVIKRKHTVKAKKELPGLIQEIIQPLQAQRIAQNQKLVAYQQTPLTAQQADHAILELYRKDVINLQRVGAVVSAWENPPHAWGDRTDGTPNAHPEATARVLADNSDLAYGSYCEATFEDIPLSLDAGRFFASEYRETLMQLIEHCVLQEGPIRDDILARRIGAAHGFQRIGNRIRDHVCRTAHRICRSTKEDVGHFFWPGGADPDTWMTFRISNGTEPRAIDEIATQELRALALLAEKDPRYQEEVPLVAMARIAGFQRLRASSRDRPSRAKRGFHPTHSVSKLRQSRSASSNLNGGAASTTDLGGD